MKRITNSLTNMLDEKLHSEDEVESFIDGIEDEILGFSIRDFYLKYKGDIKELIDENHVFEIGYNMESEILAALSKYSSQRKAIGQ